MVSMVFLYLCLRPSSFLSTDFIKYLGRTGQCKVDETPKGWFITFVDREPETLLRENLKNKRQRAELADEERHDKVLAEQIERAARTARPEDELPEVERTELLKQEGEKIAFAFGGSVLKAGGETPLHNGGSGVRTTKPSVFAEGLFLQPLTY